MPSRHASTLAALREGAPVDTAQAVAAAMSTLRSPEPRDDALFLSLLSLPLSEGDLLRLVSSEAVLAPHFTETALTHPAATTAVLAELFATLFYSSFCVVHPARPLSVSPTLKDKARSLLRTLPPFRAALLRFALSSSSLGEYYSVLDLLSSPAELEVAETLCRDDRSLSLTRAAHLAALA